MAENVINKLNIEAKGDTKQAEQSLDRLSSTMKSVQKDFDSFNTQNIESQLAGIKESVSRTASTFGDLTERQLKQGFGNAVKKFGELKNKLSMMKEGDRGYDSTLGKLGEQAEYVRAYGTELQRNGYVLGQTAEKIGEVGNKAEESGGKSLTFGERFSNACSSINTFATKVDSGMSKVGKTVGFMGKKFVNAISPMRLFNREQIKTTWASSLLGRAFARVTRMFRIMVTRMLIRGFISNVREGFQNIARYSDEVNQAFSRIGQSAHTLYNSVATAFAPLIQAIAPYIVKALDFITSAFTKVAELISALTGKSFYIKATKYNYDYAKSLDKSTKATNKNTKATDKNKKKKKELKDAQIGIDRLNVISPDKDKGTKSNGGNNKGVGNNGGVKPSDMFDTKPVSKKMKDLAKEIKKIAKKLFDPIKKAWDKKGKRVIGSFKTMLGSVWETVKAIGRDFLKMWGQKKTQKIFEDILETVALIFDTVTAISDQFRKAWTKDNVGLHIFENIRDVVGIIVSGIKDCAKYTKRWASRLNFFPLLKSIEKYTKSLKKLMEGLVGIGKDFYKIVVLGISKWIIEKGLPKLIQVFTDFNNKVDWQSLRKSLREVWKGVEKFGEAVGEGLIDFIGWLADGIKDLLNSKWFKGFLEGIGKALSKIKPSGVTTALKLFFKVWLGAKVVKKATSIFGKVGEKIGWLAGKIKWFKYSTVGSKIVGAFSGVGKKVGTKFSEIGSSLSTFFGNAKTKIDDVLVQMGGLSTTAGGIAGAIGGVALATGLTLLVNKLGAGKVEAGYLDDNTNNFLDKLDKANTKLSTQRDRIKSINNNLITSKEKAVFYKDELAKIVDKNGKIKKGYEKQAEFLVGKLNPYLNEDLKIVDGQVKGWKQQNKQIEKQIGLITAKNTLEQNGQNFYDAKQNIGQSVKDLEKVGKALGITRKGASGNPLIPKGAFSEFLVGNSKAGKQYKKQLKTVQDYYKTIIRNEALRKAVASGNDKAIEKANMRMNSKLTKAEKTRLAQLVQYSKDTGTDLNDVISQDLSTGVGNIKTATKKTKTKFGEIETKGKNSFKGVNKASGNTKHKLLNNFSDTKKGASSKFSDIKKDSNTKLNGIKNRNIKIDGDNKDAVKKIDDVKKKKLKDKKVSLFVNIVSIIKEKAGKLASVFKKVLKAFGYGVGKLLGFATGSGKKPTKIISGMAKGGFPKLGSEFIAGESGAEFVGTINGKTGVASNQEITGIRDSIVETSNAQIQMLNEQNNLLRGILEKNTDIVLDGEKVTKRVNKINSNKGYRMATT